MRNSVRRPVLARQQNCLIDSGCNASLRNRLVDRVRLVGRAWRLMARMPSYFSHLFTPLGMAHDCVDQPKNRRGNGYLTGDEFLSRRE